MSPVPVLAGAAVGLVLFALGLLLRGEDGRRLSGLLLAGAAPIAAALSTFVLFGKGFPVPPNEFLDWTLVAGIAAVVVGVLAGRGGGLTAASVLAFTGIATALFAYPTRSLHERYWNGEVAIHVAVLAGAAVLVYLGRLLAEHRGRTIEGGLATGLAAVAAAPALGLSGTSSAAMLAASVASTAGLFGLVLLFAKPFRQHASPVARALAAPQSMLLAGVLATGVLYASTPRHAAAMLLLAPLLAVLPGKGVRGAVARLVLVLGVCGAAVWLARGEPEPESPYSQYR